MGRTVVHLLLASVASVGTTLVQGLSLDPVSLAALSSKTAQANPLANPLANRQANGAADWIAQSFVPQTVVAADGVVQGPSQVLLYDTTLRGTISITAHSHKVSYERHRIGVSWDYALTHFSLSLTH
jgi:hypothetical protein